MPRVITPQQLGIARLREELGQVRRENRKLRERERTLRTRFGKILRIAKSWRAYAGSDSMLTKLGNKKAMTMQLDKEIGRALRHNETLAVMMLDLDFLKKTNDSLQGGHEAGDRMLLAVQSAIIDTIRREDFAARIVGENYAARIGGDEFVILMPNTDLNGAEIVASRVKEKLSQKGISISIGIAVMNAKKRYSKDSSRIDEIRAELLRLADKRMYEDKWSRREVR